MLRGTRDGAAARQPQDLLFLDDCASGSSAAATQAYRDSFASARAKRMRELADAEAAAKAAAEAKARGAGAAWMCEVEASSKIFTGTGRSREEALGSARSTCGSHVEASYCSKAECKKTM